MECVLYAVGSPFVEEALEILGRLGWSVRGGVANVETDYRPVDLAPVVGAEEIPTDWLSLPAVLPLVTPGHRWSVEREAVGKGFRSFATVADPTASVASTATVGEGGFVCAGALVGARATLGRLVCVNKGVIVGHHAELADYAALGPGATLAATCRSARGRSSVRGPSSTTRSRSEQTRWSPRARSYDATCRPTRSSPGTRPS